MHNLTHPVSVCVCSLVFCVFASLGCGLLVSLQLPRCCAFRVMKLSGVAIRVHYLTLIESLSFRFVRLKITFVSSLTRGLPSSVTTSDFIGG